MWWRRLRPMWPYREQNTREKHGFETISANDLRTGTYTAVAGAYYECVFAFSPPLIQRTSVWINVSKQMKVQCKQDESHLLVDWRQARATESSAKREISIFDWFHPSTIFILILYLSLRCCFVVIAMLSRMCVYICSGCIATRAKFHHAYASYILQTQRVYIKCAHSVDVYALAKCVNSPERWHRIKTTNKHATTTRMRKIFGAKDNNERKSVVERVQPLRLSRQYVTHSIRCVTVNCLRHHWLLWLFDDSFFFLLNSAIYFFGGFCGAWRCDTFVLMIFVSVH